MNAEFVQLLEAVKWQFGLTDEGVCEVISFEPSYLSKIRHGKATAGKKLIAALKDFDILQAKHLHKTAKEESKTQMETKSSPGLKRFEVQVQNLRVCFDYSTQSELDYAAKKAEDIILKCQSAAGAKPITETEKRGDDVTRTLAKTAAL